jgi:uncharacterized membrane protein (Fun14 family)
MSGILPLFGIQIGTGAIGGFLVGYAVKKVSKLIVLLVVLFLVALVYLSLNEMIGVDYEAVWQAMAELLGLVGSALSWSVSVLSLLPFAGSFVFGFILGFILG